MLGPPSDSFEAALARYVDALADRPESPGVANQYGGDAGAHRRENLRRYLRHVAGLGARVVLAGEACGYRGSAVTGVPFTSRRLFSQDLGRWGLFVPGEYVTDESLPWSEVSATVVWRAVCQYLPLPPVTVNAFPFHPHVPGVQQSNRPLSGAERLEGTGFLRTLLALFPHAAVVAVGRQAALSLEEMGIPTVAALRHPAHGGATAFDAGLRDVAAALQ